MSDENNYTGYRNWKQWNQLFSPLPQESALFEHEFSGITLSGRRLLDIGFGSGALLGWAKAKGADIAGVELQRELREAGTEAGIKTYANLAELGDTYFDVIAIFDVLEHIPRETLPSFLRSVRHIANTDAHIVIRVPNCQSAAGLLNQFGDATHVSMLSGAIVAQLCGQIGLKVLAVRESADLEIPDSGNKKLLRPLQRIVQKTMKILFRLAWSSGSTPLSANVTVIASVT